MAVSRFGLVRLCGYGCLAMICSCYWLDCWLDGALVLDVLVCGYRVNSVG